MSHYVYLEVAGKMNKILIIFILKYIYITEPRTSILGGPDIYFAEGDTINITCLVKDSPQPPQFIFWYHNKEVGQEYAGAV